MFRKYFILIPIFFSILITSIGLNKPFVGHHDFMSAFEGTIAKNYLNYGIIRTKLGQITSHPSNPPEETKSFQVSYLPLLPLLIYFSYLLFGVSEWTTRIVPAIFSVIGVIFFYLSIKKIWDYKIAFVASIFYMLNPMFIYFSKLPAPEPLLVAMFSVIFYSYLRWLDKKTNRRFLVLFLLILLGGFIGWPILYICPLLILHSLLNKQFKRKMLFLLSFLFIIPGLQFWHVYILTNQIGGYLLQTLLKRTSEQSLSFGGIDFSWGSYIKQEISWLQSYYTRIVIFLSLLNFVSLLRQKMDFKNTTVYLFLLFGVAHPILFSKYVFIHDFLNMYLLPFFALSASLGCFLIVYFFKKYKFKNFVGYGLLTIILVLFALERIDFSKALLNTDMNKDGYKMSTLLNELSRGENNKIAIVSPRFGSFYGVFTTFYTDKSYAIESESSLKKDGSFSKYGHIITIDEDISDKEFYNQLLSRYPSRKQGDVTLFKIYD